MASLIETRRNILMSAPHLTSASGSLATFNTDLAAPLKDMKVHFYPVQASGTPSPDNVLPISGWDGVTVYNGQTVVASITFPQTIYGGYVDLVKGEVVETYGKIELTGDEDLRLNPWNGNGFYWQVRETSYDTAKIPFMTGQSYGNILPYYNHGYYPKTDGSFGIVGAGTIPNYTYLTLYNSNWGTTVEEYKSALKELYDNGTPLTIVAPLKTAYIQHYPLTPQTVKTLKGINNIFSDANGDVDVTYWTH